MTCTTPTCISTFFQSPMVPTLVNFLCINITGGGVDYDSGPYIVTFPGGVTSISFDVKINDDKILETSEVFSLAINPDSLPTSVTRGNTGFATVTIVDDDGTYVCNF